MDGSTYCNTIPAITLLEPDGQRRLVSLKSELMGARKLVGRVRRLIGGAFFYDRTPSLVIRIWGTSKLIQLKALFPSWIVVVV
jgi:hypothetical protein